MIATGAQNAGNTIFTNSDSSFDSWTLVVQRWVCPAQFLHFQYITFANIERMLLTMLLCSYFCKLDEIRQLVGGLCDSVELTPRFKDTQNILTLRAYRFLFCALCTYIVFSNHFSNPVRGTILVGLFWSDLSLPQRIKLASLLTGSWRGRRRCGLVEDEDFVGGDGGGWGDAAWGARPGIHFTGQARVQSPNRAKHGAAVEGIADARVQAFIGQGEQIATAERPALQAFDDLQIARQSGDSHPVEDLLKIPLI